MSSETPDVQTYLFIKENISKYHLNIEIDSKAIKDKVIEINTMLKFVDNEPNEKRGNLLDLDIVRANQYKSFVSQRKQHWIDKGPIRIDPLQDLKI